MLHLLRIELALEDCSVLHNQLDHENIRETSKNVTILKDPVFITVNHLDLKLFVVICSFGRIGLWCQAANLIIFLRSYFVVFYIC